VNGAEADEKLAYDGLQGLSENVPMGIEEKQAEMLEMDLSLSTKRAELIELEKTIRRRQKLLDLISREIEVGMLKLEEEKKAMEKKRAQVDEPINCMMTVIEPESLTVKREGVPGLQIMGVFTLCRLLAALGWGGVTSILVNTAKAWTTKTPSKSTDVSTSTGELAAGNTARSFKPATLSFRNERARWKWPRRTVPLGRRARRACAWGIPVGQVGLRGV
jgi:hypothetical protein